MLWILEDIETVQLSELTRFLPCLSEQRRARILSMKSAPAQVQSALAALLLRYAYSQEFGGALPALTASDKGKPAFADPTAPQFNLSHCPIAIACAFSPDLVGVDVQPLHRYDVKFRRILSEAERVWVEQTDSDRRFTALWTRKEAYGKALGCGIAYDTTQTDFSGDYAAPTPCGAWLLRTEERKGYFLSFCATRRLAVRQVDWRTITAERNTFGGTSMFDAIKMKDACVQWIRDFFAENGPDCNAVLGISGGKDSSVAAALCVEALGKDRVVGVLMPNGEQHDIDMAHLLCDHLGIRRYVVNIHDAVEGVKSAIPAELELTAQSLTNLPPRIRMSTLYAVSQSLNGRVVNTCNLSEDWVGYSTRYGDAAGDFSPMSHLTVQEVKEIGRVLGLPDVLVDKVPIDGLCGKTDEDNLGFTYAVLDRYIRTGEIDDEQTKQRIDTLHRRNLFKLRLMPSFASNLPELAES